jgi:hypothetical protein
MPIHSLVLDVQEARGPLDKVVSKDHMARNNTGAVEGIAADLAKLPDIGLCDSQKFLAKAVRKRDARPSVY